MPNEETPLEKTAAEYLRKPSRSVVVVETFSVPCSECERLEHVCRDAVKKINLVVANRFSEISEKLRELREWQDARDRAHEVFYQHKKRRHSPKKAA